MQVQRQIDQLLAQRAAEWMETLKDGDRQDYEAFLNWLQQSRLHVEHYLDMECLDNQVRSLDPKQGPDVDALLAKIAPGIVTLKRNASRKPKTGRWLVPLAAAVCGLTVLGVWGMWRLHGFGSNPRIATAVGEQRTVTLPDGSLMWVNVDTNLKVNYLAGQRDIELASGEAVFKVAKDAARPFIVHTPTASVRALGTQFNVYQRSSTIVSVLEGRVQLTTRSVDEPSSGRAAVQDLGVGEEASVTNGRIEKRGHPDVGKTMAWRDRRMYFDAMPLDEIVREFNRYGGPVRLRVEGIPPRSHRFGGTFNADDPRALADILEQQSDLEVERRPGEIVIRPREGVSRPTP